VRRANGSSERTVATVANSIGKPPAAWAARAAPGATHSSVVVSPASGRGTWPVGARATKNTVSKRFGSPSGVTQRLHGCSARVEPRSRWHSSRHSRSAATATAGACSPTPVTPPTRKRSASRGSSSAASASAVSTAPPGNTYEPGMKLACGERLTINTSMPGAASRSTSVVAAARGRTPRAVSRSRAGSAARAMAGALSTLRRRPRRDAERA
jgi:hypothetical protein